MITRVHSGMQFGADLAGLVAAARCNIETGGVAPHGFRTERGDRPDIGARYFIKEHASRNYQPRTFENVKNNDATILLSPNATSSGTLLTVKACDYYSKEYYICNPFVDNPQLVVDFLRKNWVQHLNVAGNRESVCKGLTQEGARFLQTVFSILLSDGM